jgi:thiamine biosynthesis protein ThiI
VRLTRGMWRRGYSPDLTSGQQRFAHLSVLSSWCAGFSITLYLGIRGFIRDTGAAGEPRFRCVICKRFHVRLGSRLAARDGYLALCTGDSIGQVASQTMVNLAVVSEAALVPLIRPLVAFDKQEALTLRRRSAPSSGNRATFRVRRSPGFRPPITTRGDTCNREEI